jgi:hypothetical protein
MSDHYRFAHSKTQTDTMLCALDGLCEDARERSVFSLACRVGSMSIQYARSKKYKALSFEWPFGFIVLSVVVLMLIPDKSWSQQGGQSGAHRFYARSKENPATSAFYVRSKENPATLATPAIEPTSPFGQALVSCDTDAAVQETFALPGLKGEVTLDRCYKGHGHLAYLTLSSRKRNFLRIPIRRSSMRNIRTSAASRASVR